MADDQDQDSFKVDDDPKSSARVLDAIAKAERAFNPWQSFCDEIDCIYARDESYNAIVWTDPEFDLFWSSTEILKPAIYAKPPLPVVSPMFKDRRPLPNVTAEMLERSVISAFGRTDLDEAMCHVRDDLIFYNRGQLWVSLDEQKLCVEHLDRKDFLHPPARKWCDVPWVARRAWMTRDEMEDRFKTHSGDAYKDALLDEPTRDYSRTEMMDRSHKAGVWEVWHKADDRVYWVAKGARAFLDDGAPHLKLSGFFPCPRPAYGTRRPRTLEPIPDYRRYSGHFRKINTLTGRIYALLDQVRMKGLIPAGGDVGDAVEQLMNETRDDVLLIPVPGAMLSQGSASGWVQWLPLADVAAAITGLIEARKQLIDDFYQLSGISDIMRGATEAEETLGAQRLKTQYGSVRVREKIDELQRIAADVTRISAEIMAENFSKDTLLDMSQMEVPTKAEIKKQISELESAAEDEMRALMDQAQQAMQSPEAQEIDPQQAQQQMQQAQQQIIAKYGPQIKAASETVPIEDVMELLRDDKARGFAFEVATDSTIMVDETAEKASRAEFMQTFIGASQGLLTLAQVGEAGAKLAGEMLKFVLQPYRAGRELNSVIDEFIDAAPQMAAQSKEGGEDQAAMVKLAEAELAKAQAQGQNYEAQAQLKMQELQLKTAEAQENARQDQQKFELQVQDSEGKIAETAARIEKIYADIQLAEQKIQLEAHREQREDVRTAADIQGQQQDRAMAADHAQTDAAFRANDAQRAARGEDRADRQQDYSERSGDRQMTLAERQAARDSK